MSVSPYASGAPTPAVELLQSPLDLLSATARGLASSGTPLKVALVAVFDAYGLDPTSLEVEDVAGNSLVSLHKPAGV